MKEIKDNFSEQASGYAKFRPVYPRVLYDAIFELVNDFETCWDCATGNGQIAEVMAERFSLVYATDISEEQLDKAPQIPNVKYKVGRAEESGLQEDSIDLTVVGQAVHWFDHHYFNKEVVRVSKHNALVVLIGYGLMFSDEKFNQTLSEFYEGTIGDYWDPERKHIDSRYSSIPFPFEQIDLKNDFSIDVQWNLQELDGYLNTWSSVRKFIRKNQVNPVDSFVEELVNDGTWKSDERKAITFPLFVKVGRVIK